jgi:hypothetical protein
MFRNTFIDKSYLLFVNSLNPTSQIHTSKNPVENIFIINNLASNWLVPSLLIVTSILIIVILFQLKNKRNWRLMISTLLTLVLFSVLLRFQAAFFYIFPLLIAVQISLILLSYSLRPVIRYGLLSVFIFFSLINFNYSLFTPASRPYEQLRLATINAAQHMSIPKNDFNIVYRRKGTFVIVGYEYRYILRTLGYKANDEFSYNNSKYLLMISERGAIDWQKEKTWELDQFGNKTLLQQYSDKNYVWYLFEKKN